MPPGLAITAIGSPGRTGTWAPRPFFCFWRGAGRERSRPRRRCSVRCDAISSSASRSATHEREQSSSLPLSCPSRGLPCGRKQASRQDAFSADPGESYRLSAVRGPKLHPGAMFFCLFLRSRSKPSVDPEALRTVLWLVNEYKKRPFYRRFSLTTAQCSRRLPLLDRSHRRANQKLCKAESFKVTTWFLSERV